MTTKSIIVGSLGTLAAAAGITAYAMTTGAVPCIDATGEIFWARGECPSGSTPVPNACDHGHCVECPPEGCPETTESLMCCPPWSGEDDDCFQIIETTNECPPGHDVFYCQYGISNPDGTETCFFP